MIRCKLEKGVPAVIYGLWNIETTEIFKDVKALHMNIFLTDLLEGMFSGPGTLRGSTNSSYITNPF